MQVYLGDIKERLPENEQQHWKIYNVPPEGGITESRYARDFDGVFVDSDDVVDKFKESWCNFQERFESRFGFRLFLQLHEEDAHKEKGIRIPLNDDPDEFERQFNYLAVLLPDSINKEQLLKHVDTECEKLKKEGSITVLDAFLKHESLPTDIISLLRQVQNLRSSADAHRKGSKYERNIDKYGLGMTDRKEFVRKLLTGMTKAFNDLV